jgi:hypothetical protein
MEYADSFKSKLIKDIKISPSELGFIFDYLPDEYVSFTLLKELAEKTNEIITKRVNSIDTNYLLE